MAFSLDILGGELRMDLIGSKDATDFHKHYDRRSKKVLIFQCKGYSVQNARVLCRLDTCSEQIAPVLLAIAQYRLIIRSLYTLEEKKVSVKDELMYLKTRFSRASSFPDAIVSDVDPDDSIESALYTNVDLMCEEIGRLLSLGVYYMEFNFPSGWFLCLPEEVYNIPIEELIA